MAEPIEFTEANAVLGAPTGREEDVQPLHVFRYNRQCVSCWQLTLEEVKMLQENGGKIYVNVLSGGTQPPIYISTSLPTVVF